MKEAAFAYDQMIRGMTASQIAELSIMPVDRGGLGYSISADTVRRRTREAAEARVTESVDTYRQQTLDQLDLLWRQLVPEISRSNTRAITAGVQVLEAKAKLTGLNVPQQIDLSVAYQVVGIDPDDL